MVIWFKKLYLIMLDYRAYLFVCYFRSDYFFIFLFIKCISNSRIHKIDYKIELVVNNRIRKLVVLMDFTWIFLYSCRRYADTFHKIDVDFYLHRNMGTCNNIILIEIIYVRIVEAWLSKTYFYKCVEIFSYKILWTLSQSNKDEI